MTGKSSQLLIRRLLVIVVCTWLPVATMAVPPCCCFLSQMLRGSAAAACCCSTDVSPDSSLPCDSSGHSRRRCGCSVESMTATLPVAVVVVTAVEDLATGWQAQATQPVLDGPLTFADDNREWFLGLAPPRTATETCVALCRFLC